MKKAVAVLMATIIMGIAGMAMAKPVQLTGPAQADADQVTEGEKQFVKFTWCFTNNIDAEKWDNHVAYCPDELRPGCDSNVPFKMKKVSETSREVLVPMEVIAGGQSAFNLANDKDWFNAEWLFLPDCRRFRPGRNLTYYMSKPDPEIKKSGGMHVLYVGPGAPFIPSADDERLYQCPETAQASAPVADESTSAAMAELAELQKHEAVSCRVVLKGDLARTDVLRDIVRAYWHVDVEVQLSHGHEVVVVGEGGTRRVPISNKLLGQLRKLVGNPNAGDSLTSLCPEQARLIREAIGNCK